MASNTQVCFFLTSHSTYINIFYMLPECVPWTTVADITKASTKQAICTTFLFETEGEFIAPFVRFRHLYHHCPFFFFFCITAPSYLFLHVYMSFLYLCVVSLCCIVASRFCMFLRHFHTVTVSESLFVVVLLLATKLFIYHFNKEELNCIR